MTLALGIEDRTSNFLIIESSGTARRLLGSVLQETGFKQVTSVDSVQSGLDYISQEKVDYIICSMRGDENPDLIELLRVLRTHEVLQHIPLSFFVGDDDFSVIPGAFEWGAVSWHPRVFSKEAVLSELSGLIKKLERAAYHTPTVALHYLQKYYLKSGLFETARQCIESFLTRFPDSKPARLDLAECCLASGDIAAGKRLLGQFKATKYEGWEDVAEAYFSSKDEIVAEIGFTPCLVIDSDETVHNNLKRIFEEFKEFRLVMFSSGMAADEWCRENGRPGFIIQEWKCRDLPGPALLQRIRQRGWHDVPVMVLSSLVTKKDAPLLKEMGVTEVFEKPIERDSFIDALVFSIMQERDPTDLSILERKVSALLHMENFEYASLLKSRVENHPKASVGHKKYIEALFQFHKNQMNEAKKTAMEAAQAGGDPLKCLTLLARILVRLGDYDGAVKCFERAQSLSPENVERLCELADVLADKGEFQLAEEKITEAKRIDKTNDMVMKSESKLAIKSGDTERAKNIIVHMGQVSGLVSEMNNSAVALAKVSEYENAFSLYRHTIEALPEELVEIRIKVRYNLALAFARCGRLKDCLAELEEVGTEQDFPILGKIRQLTQKVKKSLETKRPLKLVSDQEEEKLSVSDDIKHMGIKTSDLSIEFNSGHAGLFKIFEPDAEEKQAILASLQRETKFELKRTKKESQAS